MHRLTSPIPMADLEDRTWTDPHGMTRGWSTMSGGELRAAAVQIRQHAQTHVDACQRALSSVHSEAATQACQDLLDLAEAHRDEAEAIAGEMEAVTLTR